MNEVETYPICPNCSADLEYADQIDTSFNDAYYFVKWLVTCPQCKRDYAIAETFKLIDREFVK